MLKLLFYGFLIYALYRFVFNVVVPVSKASSQIKSTLKGKTTPEKIRELIRKGLNNTQIAHELGISKQYIGRIIGKK